MLLDDEPQLLHQSYRLRYQVYCLERDFLSADAYPDQLERDDFDKDSVHVGAVDDAGNLAATARIVKPNPSGLPLFRYCALFPFEHTLDNKANTVVEVSRVSISRAYARPRGGADRRRRSAEPFLTLLKAVIYGARGVGATHLIGATDAALHRWLVHLGFPYRAVGPSVDYYGPVAPHIMSLADLDEVVLGGQSPLLNDFPVAFETASSPRLEERAGHIAWSGTKSVEYAMSRQADS